MEGSSYELAWVFMEGDAEGRCDLEVQVIEVRWEGSLSDRVCDRGREKALRCGF